MTFRRTPHAIPMLILIALLVGSVPLADERSDPMTARTFEVKHRSLADAAEIAGSLMSEAGELTRVNRLSTLVIEDRRSVLDRIAEALQTFDLPLRNVDITLVLLMGSDMDLEARGKPLSEHSVFTEEINGVIDKLSDFMKWADYQTLGARSVRGTERRRVEAELSQDYRVVMDLGPISRRRGNEVIGFERIDLVRVSRDEEGRAVPKTLYASSQVVDSGKLTVIGAAQSPSSRKALFLVLRAEAR